MLPAAARMRRRGEFHTAVRQGRRAGRPTLVVHLATVGDGSVPGDVGSPQVGFVVPRAVGGAVVRNRVRRRLRHLVADRLALLPAGTRLVVRVLPPAADVSFAALAADLDRALARLGLAVPDREDR